MEYVNSFKDYLKKFTDLTDEEFNLYLAPVIRVRRFDKKEVVTREGEVENFFNFIVRGLVRKYYKKGNTEINSQISTEGHLILSQESFHSRKPSEYFVETIEPTIFVSMTYEALEHVYSQSRKMEHLGRLIVTFAMIIKDNWQMQIIKMTPRERFLNFVNKNPELMQRVPQKYLASYLNIKPETFSRFKHLIRNQAKTAS
jgi:CRP-like cAMP-binding protein